MQNVGVIWEVHITAETPFKKSGRNPQEGGVFGPRILYSRSTLKTESENIYIDYDSTGHVIGTTAI